MASPQTYTVFLQKNFLAEPASVLDLFKSNTVFQLTGADDIQSEFTEGGKFRLIFNSRGTIHGQFINIADNKLIMEWNVDGFGRPKEIKTKVEISLRRDSEMCELTLQHKNILNEESVSAKKRAWTEILDAMEQRININKNRINQK